METYFDVDKLSVAAPCPKAWGDMVGDERVKFCDQCNLNVYNLAELTRKEAQNLIFSSGGRVCGRLFRRPDGTVLTKDCPVGVKALRKRISRKTAAVFATLLGLSSTVFAQHQSNKDSCQQQVRITKVQDIAAQKPPLSGTVYDPNGAVIPHATVLVRNEKTGVTTTVDTNDEGQFTFASLTEGNYALTITLSPFKSLTVKDLLLAKKAGLNIDVTLELSGTEVVGLLLGSPSMIELPPGSFTISGDLLTRLPH
ncbi:MAG TPA: carboxypeptidase-like regulatory domain-containing protein [Pyrinomonadaceae bacterium]|nr:carboxypeptidase-like regulatory domain-containing protein [Pyrinomonadaceae bacterium]